jgi:lysine 2,3-aminomutase
MKRDDIEHAARYIGSVGVRDELDEVLITGGDPLMSLPLLRHSLQQLADHAPNIRTIRIGTRVPFHDPARVNDAMLILFQNFPQFHFELGLNINHPVEFWPESVEALDRLKAIGVRLYNQHPLLKGVNDDLETLVELYELLRAHRIEAHYLFHAIPMRGMSHHRTSLDHGLRLANQLCSSGAFSGRAKPRFAVLSDIGKIVLYDGVIADRNEDDGTVLLRSGYTIEERQRWNPAWVKPESVLIENEGRMMTWYQDVVEVKEQIAGQEAA